MATWIAGAIVALIVGGAAWVTISDRHKGKSSCGGDCSKCKGCH